MASLKDQLNALKALVKKKEQPEGLDNIKEESKIAEVNPQKEKEKQKALDELKQAFNSEKEKTPFEKRQAAKAKEKQLLEEKVEQTQEPQKRFAVKEPESFPIKEKKDFLDKEKIPEEQTKQQGSGNKLKDFYYFFEDKYYNVIDKLNGPIPVYKVIDPIDKIIPSFIFFSAMFLILIVLAAFVLFPLTPETVSLTVKLTKEDSDEVLSDFTILVFVNGEENELETDVNAIAVLKEIESGSVVKVEVKNVPNYEDFNKMIKIEEDFFLEIELKRKPVIDTGWRTKTIMFKDSDYSDRLVTEFLKVSFECSKDNSFLEISGESSLNTDTTLGTIDIKVKEADCGKILVSVESRKFESINKEELVGNSVYLQRKEEEITTGTIHIEVHDELDELVSEKMKFSLFEEEDSVNAVYGLEDISIYDGLEERNGIVPGNYFVKVYDANSSNPKYFCDNPSETKELFAGEEISFIVNCSLIEQGDVLSVQVIDKNSRQAVFADIELRKEDDLEFVALKKNVSSVSFAVSDEAEYLVFVSAKDYLPYEGEETIMKGDSPIIIELVEATPENTGTAVIKVFDAQGNKASIGTVFLRYAGGPLKDLRTSYSTSIGFKGEALINTIKPGNYYAEAFSNKQKGFSIAESIDANTETEFEVQMEIIRGLVELNVTKLGSVLEIPSFNVVFFDALTKEQVLEENFLGISDNVFSFDEGTYFAVISKEGYFTSRSEEFTVSSKVKNIVNIALPKESSKESLIQFYGLFNAFGNPVTNLELGKEYSAKLMLVLNPDSNIFYFNYLVGVGREKLMENDSIFISSFNNPLDEAETKKSVSFTGNYQTDFVSNLTQSDSKAVFVEFEDFHQRTFEETAFVISFKFKLKEKILDANNLVLFYKTIAVGNSEQNPEYYLDPIDSGDFTSLEAYTYSKTKIKEFDLCSNLFCFSSLIKSDSILPACDVINYGSVSSIRIDCPYEFSSLVVNSQEDFEEIIFSIENSSVSSQPVPLDGISFEDYLIQNNSGNFSGTANDRKISEEFSFKLKELIYSEADFVTVKLLKTGKIPAIRTSLLDSGALIDENFHQIRIRSDLNLNLTVEPTEFPAFTDTDLLIAEVLDQIGNPVEAEVRIEITDPTSNDDKIVIGPKETDSLGQVYFEGDDKIKGFYPDSKIEVIAEYDNITAVKTFFVSRVETFSFSPESMQFNFFNFDDSVKTKELTFFDLSDGTIQQEILSYGIEVSNIEYFNENLLNGYEGELFSSEGLKVDFSLSLDSNQTKELIEAVSFDANLNLTIELGSYSFVKQIPFSIAINPLSQYLAAYFPVNGQEVNAENKVLIETFADENSSVKFELKEKNVNANEIIITETEVNSDSTYLNLNEMNSLLSVLEGQEISDSLEIDFEVIPKSSAVDLITEKTTEDGNILFSVQIDDINGFIAVPFQAVLLPSADAMLSLPKQLNYIFYLGEKDSQKKTISFLSNSVSSLKINDISFNMNSGLVLAQPIQFPSIIGSTDWIVVDLNLTLSNEAIALETSKTIEGFVDVNYSVKGRDLIESIPVKVSIITVVEPIDSEKFNLSYCIGEGALNDVGEKFNVNFWLGCNVPEQGIVSPIECSTEKPKVLLEWDFASFNVDSYEREGPCTKENEADKNYVYCDAAQFSMELVNRLIDFQEEDLGDSFSFRANLISDNFSDEFFEDFDEWATNFSRETPTPYTSEESTVRKYFRDNLIYIEVDSESETEISVPGWYVVEVTVERNRLEINFDLKRSSSELEEEDSVFYYLPFDGIIGLKNSEFDRTDYGSNFDVAGYSDVFKVNSDYSIYSSSLTGYTDLILRQFNDLNSINSTEVKGTLMKVVRSLDKSYNTIEFYPSNVTPLIMELTLDSAQDSEAFYSITDSENNALLAEQENLLNWVGLGESCLGFSGTSLLNKTFSDSNAGNEFKLPFVNVSKTGKMFLGTTVFSPKTENYLKENAVKTTFDEIKFYSKTDSSNFSSQNNWIELNGILAPESLQELFDLIEDKKVCVKNEGNTTLILWNQEKLAEEFSEIESIRNLNIESDCIQE